MSLGVGHQEACACLLWSIVKVQLCSVVSFGGSREFKIPVRAQHVRQIKWLTSLTPVCGMFEVGITSTELLKPVLQVLKKHKCFS